MLSATPERCDMELSKTATGLLAAVCIVGGAGGTYLALRPQAAGPAPLETTVLATASAGPVLGAPGTAPAPVPTVDTERSVVQTQPARAPKPVARRPVPRPAEAPARPTEVGPGTAPPVVTVAERAPLPVAPVDVADEREEPIFAPALDEVPYEDLVVAADSVIGLQLEGGISSETARVEDSVVARVTRDVRVADRIVIPSGARVYGEVTLVETGGRVRDRARLGVRFNSIALADGTDLAIRTEPIYREGDAPGRESAAKIGGGAIGGAILGGILGGAKGAAIGSSVGAGAGTAAVVAGGRNHAVLSPASPLTVRLEEPLVVTVER